MVAYAEILYADGRREPIEPGDPIEGEDLPRGTFPLKQLQEIVGGYVEILLIEDGRRCMILNDNGKAEGLPVNVAATKLWAIELSRGEVPFRFEVKIVGNVLVCDRKLIA